MLMMTAVMMTNPCLLTLSENYKGHRGGKTLNIPPPLPSHLNIFTDILYRSACIKNMLLPLNLSRRDTEYFMQRKYRLYIAINHLDSSSPYSIIRAAVLPSQRHDRVYQTAVAVQKMTGSILYGKCSCIAGRCSSCNHVAALLFKVDDINRDLSSKGNRGPSCTSLPATWNVPCPQKVDPKPVRELEVIKPTIGKVAREHADYEPIDRISGYVSMQRVMKLRTSLSTTQGESLAFHQVWPATPDVRQEALLVENQFTKWHKRREVTDSDNGVKNMKLYEWYSCRFEQ